MSSRIPAVALSYERLTGETVYTLITTGTKLIFLARSGEGAWLRLHSPCCSKRLHPLNGGPAWLCGGCQRVVVDHPQLFPDCSSVSTHLEEYLLRMAQAYYEPLTAVVVASELFPPLERYLSK